MRWWLLSGRRGHQKALWLQAQAQGARRRQLLRRASLRTRTRLILTVLMMIKEMGFFYWYMDGFANLRCCLVGVGGIPPVSRGDPMHAPYFPFEGNQ